MPSTSTFKGFRQVSKAYFESLPDEEKIGYLWFVRSNIDVEEGTYDGDIFLGTRCYGHHGSEAAQLEERLNRILQYAGIIDESGNTVNLGEEFLSKDEADEEYVKKVTLFNDDETGEDPIGILIISGDDLSE